MSASLAVTSGQIAFTEIPYVWRVPGTYMEVKPALNQNAIMPFPVQGLILGQMYATGTATPGVPYPLYTKDQANQLFGAGSQAALMAAIWLANNPYTKVWIIGIADATGSVKAAGGVAISGTATQAATWPFYFGGVRVAVPVNVGDTAADVAANLYAQMQLQGQSGYPYLPYLVPSYVAAASSVTLTCGHGGTVGNEIDIRVNARPGEATPPGLTVTITPMSGGATDPDAAISAALDALSSTWYNDVVFPWTDSTNLPVFITWLADRYDAMAKLDAQGYVPCTGTYGTVLAFEPNSQYITTLPFQNPMTPGCLSATALGAQCCYWTAQAPSLQLKTVPLVGVVAPAQVDQFSPAENETLLQAGLSTYYTDDLGNVYLLRVVTTRRTDATGALTDAFFDISSTKVPTRVRYDWDTYCSEVWPRNHLCDDGSIAADYDPWAVTPRVVTTSWTARSTLYEQQGWIKNSAATAKASSFAIDPNDSNRLNGRQQIDIMGNLMVLAGSLEFLSNN